MLNEVIIKEDYAVIDCGNDLSPLYTPRYASCSLEDIDTLSKKHWRSRGKLGPFCTTIENGIDYPLHMANYLLKLPRQERALFVSGDTLDCRRENITIRANKNFAELKSAHMKKTGRKTLYNKKRAGRPINANVFTEDVGFTWMGSKRTPEHPIKVDTEDVPKLREFYWSMYFENSRVSVHRNLKKNGACIGRTQTLAPFLLGEAIQPGYRLAFRNGQQNDYRRGNIFYEKILRSKVNIPIIGASTSPE